MELTLQADVRTEKGTGVAHKLRQQGRIPAVVYAKGEAEMLSLPSRETERLVDYAGTGRLIDLHVKRGKKEERKPVLIKEIQRHPTRGAIIHVDFQAVTLDKAIVTHVGLHLVGEERRIHDGAVIEQYLRDVEISCLPTQIPGTIMVDVSGLAMGASIHVRDLTPPDGVKFVTNPDEVIVTAAAPGAVEAAAPAAAAPEAAGEKTEEEKA